MQKIYKTHLKVYFSQTFFINNFQINLCIISIIQKHNKFQLMFLLNPKLIMIPHLNFKQFLLNIIYTYHIISYFLDLLQY